MENQLNMEMLFLEPLVEALRERGGKSVHASQEGFLEAVLAKRNLKPFQFGTTEKGGCLLKTEIAKALKILIQQEKIVVESKGVWSLTETTETQKPLSYWLQEDKSLIENFKRFSTCYQEANFSKKECQGCFCFSDCQERKKSKKEEPVVEEKPKKTIDPDVYARSKNTGGKTIMCSMCSATIGKDEVYRQNLDTLNEVICLKCYPE